MILEQESLFAKEPATARLPNDSRFRMGGYLFLLSLLIFFLTSILLYGIYAYSRYDDPQRLSKLPVSFLVSSGCLVIISLLVHAATRFIRRERRVAASSMLAVSTIAASVFLMIQVIAMVQMLTGPGMFAGTSKGVTGMIVVLAILHGLHVLGGVFALGVVAIRSLEGRYDHERHWPVDFAAQYWHFLDVIWICMLATFWLTTGGF